MRFPWSIPTPKPDQAKIDSQLDHVERLNDKRHKEFNQSLNNLAGLIADLKRKGHAQS